MQKIIKIAVLLVGVIALTGCGVKYTTPDSAFKDRIMNTNYDRIYLDEPTLRVTVEIDETVRVESIRDVDVAFLKKTFEEQMKSKKINVEFSEAPDYVIRVYRVEKFDGNMRGYSGVGAGGAQAGYMATGTVSGGLAGGVAMSAIKVAFPPKSWVVEFSILNNEKEHTRFSYWGQSPDVKAFSGTISVAAAEYFELRN